MWPAPGFHAFISLLFRSEFNLSGMLVPETWAWGLSYHSLNQMPPLGLVCYTSWQLPERHCWSHFTDWETDVQLLLSHQLKLNYNTCGSLKKYGCYNQRHRQLSVCGEGWGRQAEGRAFRWGSWEESTGSFHILGSGSNSVPLPWKKKLCLPRGQNMPLFGNRVMNM